MKSSRLIKAAATSILKNKMRTLLTMLGIIIGVGAVIVMVAIGSGARHQIEEQINNLGTNMIVITPGAVSRGGVSQGAQSFNRLTIEDAEKLERESIMLSAVTPVIVTRTQAVGGAGNWRTTIQGVGPTYEHIRDWHVSSGRFFHQGDLRAIRKVVVLGKTVADNLFPGQDPVGQQIRLRRVPMEVIGVLQPKGQTPTGNDQDDVIVVPYTTVQNRLAGWQFIGQILASTSSPEDVQAAQEEIRLIMREAHQLGAWEEDDFTVRNQTDLATAATGTTEVMTMLLAAIASISLLVGGIGIMNIMLVSVTERTREIGIRLAVGAREGDILVQFLVESIVISVVGGLIGVAMGYGVSELLERFVGWPVLVAPEMVFLALGFAAGVGIFFGFYPARKAAALNPIEALRYE